MSIYQSVLNHVSKSYVSSHNSEAQQHMFSPALQYVLPYYIAPKDTPLQKQSQPYKKQEKSQTQLHRDKATLSLKTFSYSSVSIQYPRPHIFLIYFAP